MYFGVLNIETCIYVCKWFMDKWFISPECRIYASVNRVRIGSGQGLLPIRYQVIIQLNAGLSSIGPLGTKFSGIVIKIRSFS